MNKPFEPRLRRYSSFGSSVAAITDDIVTALAEGIHERDKASIVVSGGTTPGPLFDALAICDVAWARVAVTLTDERWVSASDPRSNENLVRSRLLQGNAARARLIAFKTPHETPAESESMVDAAVSIMPRPFDIALLGMGTDGHIASLFPQTTELSKALDVSSPRLVCAVTPPDQDKLGLRMSLTLRALLGARRIVLFIRGDEKMAALRAAMDGDDVHAMPVRAILKQAATPVEIVWSP